MAAAAQQPITPSQMRALWASARDHGYDQEGLRDLVERLTGGRSISGLTSRQASTVLDSLRPQPKPRPRRQAGDDHGQAPSEAQQRKIHALWGELGRRGYYEPAARGKALREFLKKRFGVEHERFLSVGRARQVIEALKDIVERLPHV